MKMTWTSNGSRFWMEEFVAKVRIPQAIHCPTPDCPGTAAWHNCHNKSCCWFVCDICECTTWFSPKLDKGPLGKQVVKWAIRSRVRIPRMR